MALRPHAFGYLVMAHVPVIDGDRAVGTAIQTALGREGQVGVVGAGRAGSKAAPSDIFDPATVDPGPQP